MIGFKHCFCSKHSSRINARNALGNNDSTLAKGAVEMSKHKVIVRDLGSIQTFGEMDVLCTDKTGTLTEDKIVLERYMNVVGQDDKRILRHAYLNSYFQTGLKNLIDIAI